MGYVSEEKKPVDNLSLEDLDEHGAEDLKKAAKDMGITPVKRGERPLPRRPIDHKNNPAQ